MDRRQRLISHGWHITTVINTGDVIAKKGTRSIHAASVTAIHKQVFGY